MSGITKLDVARMLALVLMYFLGVSAVSDTPAWGKVISVLGAFGVGLLTGMTGNRRQLCCLLAIFCAGIWMRI